MRYNKLEFINCACPFTEKASSNDGDGKRSEVKKLIKELKKVNPNVDYNIFKAVDNINLDCVLGVKENGCYKSFLEDYDNRK